MVKYEVKKEIADLGGRGKHRLRLDLVSWNDGPPCLDLRLWYESSWPDRLPGKGIVLDDEQASCLLNALNDYFRGSLEA